MRWPLLLAACLAVGFLLTGGQALAQTVTVPGAPDMPSVAAGTGSLTVVWSASDDGGATITAYDVRHIETDASDKADANWTVIDDAWTTGTLSHTIAGLRDSTSHDVQVRAESATGQIRVGAGAVLDHESRDSYSVTVIATDPSGESDRVDVTITVTNVNERPTATDNTATTNEDTATSIDVLDNDSDPETAKRALTVTLGRAPTKGTATLEASGDITYTPNDDIHCGDSFTYSISDGSLSHMADVFVTVNSVNDPPRFASPSAARSISEDAAEGDDVGARLTASDADRDVLTYELSGSGDFENR